MFRSHQPVHRGAGANSGRSNCRIVEALKSQRSKLGHGAPAGDCETSSGAVSKAELPPLDQPAESSCIILNRDDASSLKHRQSKGTPPSPTMHMDESLKSFLASHAREHNGYFDKEAVESEFAHAVTVALGDKVVAELGRRSAFVGSASSNGNGKGSTRKTAGCGNLIDRVQKAYSCK